VASVMCQTLSTGSSGEVSVSFSGPGAAGIVTNRESVGACGGTDQDAVFVLPVPAQAGGLLRTSARPTLSLLFLLRASV